MPFGDGTGPMGQGPMTGRRMGYCAGYNTPGYANPVFGRGGFGQRWFGRGRGYRYWARVTDLPGWYRAGLRYRGYLQTPFTPKEEKEILREEKKTLEEEIKALKQGLEEIDKRIKELKGPQK